MVQAYLNRHESYMTNQYFRLHCHLIEHKVGLALELL